MDGPGAGTGAGVGPEASDAGVKGRKTGALGVHTTAATAGSISESRSAPPEVAAFEEKEKAGAAPRNGDAARPTSPKSPTPAQRGLASGPRGPLRGRSARGKGREEVGSDGIGRLDA